MNCYSLGWFHPFSGCFTSQGFSTSCGFQFPTATVLGWAEHHGPVPDCLTTYSSYLQSEKWGLRPLPVLPAPVMIFIALPALPTSPLVITFYLFMKHTYQRDIPKKIN